jgi:RNA polymerase sigma-70 factor, ECF subfamily
MNDPQAESHNASVFDRSLSAARAGSSSALGAVLEACRAYLLVVASREVELDLRAKVAPSDLVQETCITAHRNFDRFNGTTREELIAWLRRILERRLRKAQRQFRGTAKRSLDREISMEGLSSVTQPHGTAGDVGGPGQSVVAEEDAARLAQALSRLPTDYQLVIRLRNWELLPFATIGREMDRSADAARGLWSRAIQRLAAELESGDAR